MATKLFACCAAACLILAAQSDSKKRKELTSGYQKWIEDDVAYIITDAERQAFTRLQNDEEREQFVEQFWLRRDPTPDTIENEYKEEHYRRIAYANERFNSGVPGWKTDRGRTYIKFGPPDEVASHPSGGSYQRPLEQGGGTTQTYPFETWRYRYIEEIGNDVVIEFVDRSMSGEYRMAFDPAEKEALTRAPGSQPTVQSRPFDQLTRIADLQRPPALKFRDLSALVTSSVKFNTLPMKVRADFLRVTDSTIQTPVTVQFETRDLQFKKENGVERAVVNLYLRVTSMTRRVVAEQEDVVTVTVPEGMRPDQSLYQTSFYLAPGTYRLNVAAKDITGGNTNAFELALHVPEHLSVSSIILADQIERVPSRSSRAGAFVLGDSKVRPRVSASFRRDEKMGIYFQIYDTEGGSVEYQVTKNGSSTPLIDFTEEVSGHADQITIAKMLPLNTLEGGEYTLKIVIKNRDQVVTSTVPFSVMWRDL